MVAENGPYLATNVPAVRTYLGEQLAVPPQLALCRCGQSAMKPFCDGTHARSGFSGEKDPGRVPDQRDSYPGQQVTVFDNRGICQHSGLCTDRLPTVFRTGAEPFVAPSGGRLDEIIRAVRDCPSGALSLALGKEEARPLVDWDAEREAAIEVSLDGPYRVTGAIPLTDAAGADVARAAGSSREHYALCRCGHSRNKPFCSGMHWYAGFRDPVLSGEPTLFQWAGGLPALTRMTRLLYEKLVPADDLLAPVFAGMAARAPAARGDVARRGVRRPRVVQPAVRRRGRAAAGARRPRVHRASSGNAGWRWRCAPPTRPGCPPTRVPRRARRVPGVGLARCPRRVGGERRRRGWDWGPAEAHAALGLGTAGPPAGG